MFTLNEEKALKQRFWDCFGTYCKPRLMEEGKRSWLMYHTHIKGLELKYTLSRSMVSTMIEINHKDEDRRLRIYEALNDYRALIDDGIDGIDWQLTTSNDAGRDVSQIRIVMPEVDYLDQTRWPEIFAFMYQSMNQLENNFLDIHDSLKNELKQ